MNIRVGSGFDVHRLAEGNGLTLGGFFIESNLRLVGHSDADVLIHSLCDAIYGALAEGDIGMHFPDTSEENRGRDSGEFLKHAMNLAARKGFALSNIDATLICERPKISPHRTHIRDSLARLTSLPVDQIGVKATTTEKLGFTGRGEGIAAMTTILLYRNA